ncbi:MAG: site-2 protease family protein [Clostridia bacterium]|nr:site-2 protease family protein [Clostridia bacterium]
MLLDLIQMGDVRLALIVFLLTVPSMLIALTFHEVAHGFVAYKCGDPTAKNLGRLTLNPIKHLDPIGTLLMLLVGYGWARPVPVNSRYFKNPRKGMALTALAGPLTNLILGFLGVALYWFVYSLAITSSFEQEAVSPIFEAVILFAYYFSMLNLTFAVFNMIPLPPFDGSRIFLVFLPPKYYFGVMKYERIILLVVLLSMYFLPWSPVHLVVDFLFNKMSELMILILF